MNKSTLHKNPASTPVESSASCGELCAIVKIKEIKMNDIKQILVEGQGWKYARDGKFEWTGYNGHMAKLPWIKQTTTEGIKEYNINYVVQIEYFDDSTQQQLAGSPSAHPND